MSCNSKINSLDYLIKNGATDDIRKILDLSLFNELNDTLTEYAKTKYNLETGDEKLFSAGEQKSIYLKDTPYYRDSTYNVYRAIPNEALFTQLDILVSEYENRPDTDQPMFMKTPSVNYSLKIVETLGKINRGTFETSKLQGWLNDLQKQGVSNQQLELFKEVAKPGMTKDEIAVAIAAAYSYTVDINIATEPIESANVGYDRFTLNGDDYSKIDTYRKNGNVITKEEYNLATEQYKKTENLGDRNTQYYSNLSVPGGINYTEQEIATPEITPSIKGHAQFATDQGIGWFRSDEKAGSFYEDNSEIDLGGQKIQIEGGIRTTDKVDDTKTRRILEVQSDLFQKSRDRESLIQGNISSFDEKEFNYNNGSLNLTVRSRNVEGNLKLEINYNNQWNLLDSNIFKGNTERNEFKDFVEKEINLKKTNTNSNQFLQLLNKDNNWVTFFVKSIMQDSAKKGYEKVLFPTGDTASKVESHTTLEEYKKEKENRIKKIEVSIKTNKKYYDQVEKKEISLLKKLKTSDFLKKDDLGYIYNSKEKTVYLINKRTNDEVKLSHGYWSNNKISIDVNSEKEAKLIFDKFINGENISDEDSVQNINQVIDIMSKDTIEDEIKRVKRDQVYYIEKNLDFESEIKQLKQELERVEGPEGFGALRPIYNFYENTLFNILKKQFGKERIIKITDEYGNTWNELTIEPNKDLDNIVFQRYSENLIQPSFEFDLSTIQNARAKEIVSVLSQRLSLGLKVNYANITQEQAINLLKRTKVPYQGEPGFYFAGTIYTVGDNVSINTVLHEFSHPLLQGIAVSNPELFNNLFNLLESTTEGQQIVDYVTEMYPELEKDSIKFKEEALAWSLQTHAANILANKIETKGFDSFIKNLLYQIKLLLKKVFGNEKVIKDLNVNTSIEKLADMLLEKDFVFESSNIKEEDVAMFLRNETEKAKVLIDSASTKAITESINTQYAANQSILEMARKHRTNENTKKIVLESFIEKGTNKLIPAVQKALRTYQTILKSNNNSIDVILDNALDAEAARLKDLNNRALSLVNSLEVTNNVTNIIIENLEKLKKKKNFGSRDDIYLLSLYRNALARWYQSLSDIDGILTKDFVVDNTNPFSQLLSQINLNIIRGEKIAVEISKINSINFFVENTKYMSDFVTVQANKDLLSAIDGKLTESEFNDFFNKVKNNTITEKDLEELSNKGVEQKYIKEIIDRFNYFIINEDTIIKTLEGKYKDVSILNRFMESYSSSNSPIVGSLAIYIDNQKKEAEQRMWKASLSFRNKLQNLLPKISEFSKWNSRDMLNLVSDLDSVSFFNKETNKMEKREVYTFLNAFGNGWRYDLDNLEFNVDEARKDGDVDKLKKAELELKTFNEDYMNREFVPEYYEKDKIFEDSKIGQLAWLDRKLALDEFNAESNKLHNELERFESYTITDAAWHKYQSLYSLYYEDGTPKIDDEANEIYDLSKALLLREHRNATKDFNEYVAVPGSLQKGYNEFINQLITQGVKINSDEYNVKLKDWIKMNTKLVYDPKYYEKRSELLTRLSELQEKMKVSESDFNVSTNYKEIGDLIYTYKDEQGQPDPKALGVEKIKKIKDLQQKINDYRFNNKNVGGLSKTESEELINYVLSAKKRTLTKDEEKRYLYLLEKSSGKGLTIEETVELNAIYNELGDSSATLPTDYYMDELNFRLSKYLNTQILSDDVDAFINSDEFYDIVANDESFQEWFILNHVTKKTFDITRKDYVNKYQRTVVNNITVPSDPSLIKTTKILNEATGEEILIMGVPNIRHSVFNVKDKYRTLPYNLTEEDKNTYIGKIIDNKGNFLPKMYDGTLKGAKTDKYMNKKYADLKRSNSATFELLNAITEYHLQGQENKANVTKLYLDVPRYVIDSKLDVLQSGNASERYNQIKANTTEFFKQMFGQSKVNIENNFNYNPENNLVNTDAFGQKMNYIPVSGLYNLEPNVVSPDVFKSLMRYSLSLETYGVLEENLPLMKSLIETLSSAEAQPKAENEFRKDIYNAYGVLENVTKKGSENNVLGQVKSLFEREFYGVHQSETSENYPKITALLNGMQKMSAMASLAINIPADLKNKYSGMVQLIIEASGNEHIGLKDLAFGRSWAFKSMINWSSKKGIYAVGPPAFTTQLIEMFDPAFRTKDNMGRSVSRSLYKDLINGEWLYMFRKFGEMEVALSLFGSFLNAQKVDMTMPDGTVQLIRYVDAWENNSEGIITLKKGIHPKWNNTHVYHTFVKGETLASIAKQYNVTEEELIAKNKISSVLELAEGDEIIIAKAEGFNMFRNQVQGTSRALFGAYDSMGQPEGNKYTLYRLYMFMRKWFTPMFVNRFGSEVIWEKGKLTPKFMPRYDWALGKTVKGYYLTAFSAMWEMIKSRGQKAKYLRADEKIALKKLAAESLFITSFALLTALLFGYDEDDEDKWKKIGERSEALGTKGYDTQGYMINHLLLLMQGVNAETTAFIPLPKIMGLNFGGDDYGKMLTSTSSVFANTVLLYGEIGANIFNGLTGEDSAKYKRDAGPYPWEEEGDYKLINNILKTIGFTGSTGDPETGIKNLANSSSKLGR